jgi:hypothetical protein
MLYILRFLIYHTNNLYCQNVFFNIHVAYQGTYLTSTARSHARDCNLHEGTVIGNFNGEFWGMFASNQVNDLVFL